MIVKKLNICKRGIGKSNGGLKFFNFVFRILKCIYIFFLYKIEK